MRTRKIIIIILILLISLSVFAIKPGWGLKLGMTVNFHDHNLNRDLNAGVGFDIGIFKEFKLGWGYFFLAEVHYVSKGVTESLYYYTYPGYDGVFETYYNYLHYLSFPLLLGYEIKFRDFGFYFFFGPRFDFLLGYNSQSLNYYYDKHKDLKIGFDIGYGNRLSFFSALSSKREFDQVGPRPSLLGAQGVVGRLPPYMEEQPVALATASRSPNSWLSSLT